MLIASVTATSDGSPARWRATFCRNPSRAFTGSARGVTHQRELSVGEAERRSSHDVTTEKRGGGLASWSLNRNSGLMQ
jgi:hypothetical protein